MGLRKRSESNERKKLALLGSHQQEDQHSDHHEKSDLTGDYWNIGEVNFNRIRCLNSLREFFSNFIFPVPSTRDPSWCRPSNSHAIVSSRRIVQTAGRVFVCILALFK